MGSWRGAVGVEDAVVRVHDGAVLLQEALVGQRPGPVLGAVGRLAALQDHLRRDEGGRFRRLGFGFG